MRLPNSMLPQGEESAEVMSCGCSKGLGRLSFAGVATQQYLDQDASHRLLRTLIDPISVGSVPDRNMPLFCSFLCMKATEQSELCGRLIIGCDAAQHTQTANRHMGWRIESACN